MKPIYPQIHIDTRAEYIAKDSIFFKKRTLNRTIIGLRTFLRVEHEGKMYLQEFFREHQVPAQYEKEHENEMAVSQMKIICLNKMNAEVYTHVICGVIDPTLKNQEFGTPIHPLDENQLSEKERTSRLYNNIYNT